MQAASALDGHHDVFRHGEELLKRAGFAIQARIAVRRPHHGDHPLPAPELVRARPCLLDDAHTCACLVDQPMRHQAPEAEIIWALKPVPTV